LFYLILDSVGCDSEHLMAIANFCGLGKSLSIALSGPGTWWFALEIFLEGIIHSQTGAGVGWPQGGGLDLLRSERPSRVRLLFSWGLAIDLRAIRDIGDGSRIGDRLSKARRVRKVATILYQAVLALDAIHALLHSAFLRRLSVNKGEIALSAPHCGVTIRLWWDLRPVMAIHHFYHRLNIIMLGGQVRVGQANIIIFLMLSFLTFVGRLWTQWFKVNLLLLLQESVFWGLPCSFLWLILTWFLGGS
jgi:hypothetical protein